MLITTRRPLALVATLTFVSVIESNVVSVEDGTHVLCALSKGDPSEHEQMSVALGTTGPVHSVVAPVPQAVAHAFAGKNVRKEEARKFSQSFEPEQVCDVPHVLWMA